MWYSIESTFFFYLIFKSTGAFGGNPCLMSAIQILAARFARVHELVYHTFDNRGTAAFDEAKILLEEELDPTMPTYSLAMEYLQGKHFKWGVSDGN